MSLYTDLIEAGVEVSNHESDLYFPSTAVSRPILKRHPAEAGLASCFRSNIDGKTWIDVPFAFDPFWEKRQ